MGSAAAGVYALDISDPAHFGGERGVLFEFTERDDADIGNIFGAPALARLRIGAVVGDYLVVGGGYNSAARGRLALFLLSLNKDAAEPWQLNRNYFKLAAPADDAWPNGLGPAALAADEDGNARFAYAGDLQGNLWRFDLGALASGRDAERKLVFIASDKDGRRQPITSAPRIAYAPDGLLLLFGSGRLLAAGDGNDRSPQTLYGVRDHAASTQPLRRDSLAARLLAIDGSYRLAAVEAADGWYLDFPEAGERSVAGALLADDQLVVASVIPRGVACAADSRLYWLETLFGKPAPGISAPWLLPADVIGRKPVLLPRVEAGAPDSRGQRAGGIRRSLVGAGDAAGAALPRDAGSTAGAAGSQTGRLGWREIIDIEGLRDAALRP
jgi:type IV pilus assembly protein PilY1